MHTFVTSCFTPSWTKSVLVFLGYFPNFPYPQVDRGIVDAKLTFGANLSVIGCLFNEFVTCQQCTLPLLPKSSTEP